MSSSSSPKLVTEVSQDTMAKIDATCDFILQMRERIANQYQRWYTLKEAAAYMRVSRATLIQNMRSEIQPIRRGRIIVYDRNDLDAYWDKRKEKQQ